MEQHDLKKRTKQFALRCMQLCDTLPSRDSGRVISNQLLRSSTSVAANYRAACRARSKAEFLSKLGIVEEEVDESALWLELVMEGGLLKPSRVEALYDEADQLTRIVVASIVTSRSSRSIPQSARPPIRNPKSAIRNSR